MTDRPIIFSGAMVRALLEGRKTMTRRLLQGKFTDEILDFVPVGTDKKTGRPVYEMKDRNGNHVHIACGKGVQTPIFYAPYAVGDRLYVRENFSYDGLDIDHDLMWPAWYWADGEPKHSNWAKQRPAIHMPKIYSRLTLTVTAAKVERLQDISEEDAIAEGIYRQRLADWAVKGQLPPGELIAVDDPASLYLPWPEYQDKDGWHEPEGAWDTAKGAFRSVWENLNAKRAPWDSNPWVVAVSFGVIKSNIDRIGHPFPANENPDEIHMKLDYPAGITQNMVLIPGGEK